MRFTTLCSNDSGSFTGSPYSPKNTPDHFGLITVNQNGDKYAANSAFRAYYQGSWDNISWFDLAIFKPSETDFQDSDTNSWTRVVPLCNYVRFKFVSNDGELINATLGE
jgi:hypothetical protein